MPENKANSMDLAAMPVIDWQRGKELMNGRLAEAKQLLHQLLIYIPEVLQHIRNAYKARDMEQLLIHVHKLHGACCYCGVPRLKQAAKSLEVAIRKNHHKQVTELTQALEAECQLLLATAEQDPNLHT